MPKITCKCGYVMNISSLNEEFAYNLISQNALWDIVDICSEQKDFTSEKFIEPFNQESVEVYECPSCKRLLIEESSYSNRFNFYKKETE